MSEITKEESRTLTDHIGLVFGKLSIEQFIEGIQSDDFIPEQIAQLGSWTRVCSHESLLDDPRILYKQAMAELASIEQPEAKLACLRTLRAVIFSDTEPTPEVLDSLPKGLRQIAEEQWQPVLKRRADESAKLESETMVERAAL